jgi:basic membrane protein A and related proteins
VRRIACTAAMAGLVAVLAGSGASSASTPLSGPSGTTAAARFKACLVTDIGGIDDRSFNELSWQGVRAAAVVEPPQVRALFLQSADTADYQRNIATFIKEKCGIIVTVGFLVGSATENAARAHPRREFAIVDCTYSSGCLTGRRAGNLDRLAFNTVQDAFLGGYLAGATSRTDVVATFGGFRFGTVTIYMDGFWTACSTTASGTTPTSRYWAGTREPRKAPSPAASLTSGRASASPAGSSAREPILSSRSLALPA